MRPFMALFAIIAILIFAGQASALLACSEITLEKGAVFEVKENDITILPIKIVNNTNEDFNISNFEIIENSSLINAEVSDYNRTIVKNDSGIIKIRLESFSVNEESTADFTLRVAGDSDNLTCTFSKISQEFEVTILDSEQFSGACTNIDIATHEINIESGKESTGEFSIQNNSTQNLIADSVELSDNNYQVRIEELSFDREIKVGEAGGIQIRATGLTGEDFDGNAILNFKGHFTDQKSCEIIKKIPFTFTSNTASCAIQLMVDSIQEIKGNNQLNVRIVNPSTQDGIVQLQAENAVLSPSSIAAAKNSDQIYPVLVENNSLTNHSETIILKPDFGTCTVPEKAVKVFFGNEINSPIEIQNISDEYDLSKSETLNFTIENKSNDEIQARVEVKNLSSGWKAENKIITLKANETQAVELKVLPGNEKEIAGIVSVEANDYVVEKIVKLTGPGKTIDVKVESVEKNADGSYTVTSSIQNNSNTEQRGEIQIGVPSIVPTENKKAVSIAGHETKTVTFQVNPSNPSLPASVVFKGADKSGAAEFNFEVPSSGRATAFDVFASSAILGWIVVLSIVMVGAAYLYKRSEKKV